MKKTAAALLVAVLLGGPGDANADTIVATFFGEVISLYDPADGRFTAGIQPGSPVMATVTYDATATPLATGTGFAEYAVQSWSVRVGDREIGADEWSGRNTILVENDRDGKDALTLNGSLHPAQHAPDSHFQLSLVDPTQSVFSTTGLPTSFDVEQFGRGDFFLLLKPADADWSMESAQVSGSVTTLPVPTAQTPEPSALALAAAAGVGLLGASRRRRSGTTAAPTERMLGRGGLAA